MLWNMFSVYDNKARAWLPPWVSHNHDTARRIFAESISDEKHIFAKHGEDYVLFHIGAFNDATGLIEAIQPAHNLGLASQYTGGQHGGNGSTESA